MKVIKDVRRGERNITVEMTEMEASFIASLVYFRIAGHGSARVLANIVSDALTGENVPITRKWFKPDVYGSNCIEVTEAHISEFMIPENFD
jgi:hypothetical protein